jgi:hypothetical protein
MLLLVVLAQCFFPQLTLLVEDPPPRGLCEEREACLGGGMNHGSWRAALGRVPSSLGHTQALPQTDRDGKMAAAC